MALSFAKAGASYIAISARSDLSEVESEVKRVAVAAGRKEPKVLTLKLEVTDIQSVDNAVELIADEFGKLDVVINNAGIIGEMASITDSSPEVWWRTSTYPPTLRLPKSGS